MIQVCVCVFMKVTWLMSPGYVQTQAVWDDPEHCHSPQSSPWTSTNSKAHSNEPHSDSWIHCQSLSKYNNCISLQMLPVLYSTNYQLSQRIMLQVGHEKKPLGAAKKLLSESAASLETVTRWCGHAKSVDIFKDQLDREWSDQNSFRTSRPTIKIQVQIHQHFHS